MTLSREDIEREVRWARETIQQDFVFTVSEQELKSICERLVRLFSNAAAETQPLKSAECGIVTFTKRKTAALIADRVWGTDMVIDKSISFGWNTTSEVRIRACMALYPYITPMNDRISDELQRIDADAVVVDLERELTHSLHSMTGAQVQPLFDSAARRDIQYRNGDEVAVICTVNNLGIVDEEQLSWKQVIEFRRDEEAKTAYRRFIHWLDKEMCDKPVGYISDEIAGRLEKYEWSLKKHGIQTVLGSLNNLLNPGSLISASATAFTMDLITGKPIWSLLASGGILVGQAAVSMAKTLVERRDIEMAHREIAYVQELKSKLGGEK